MLNLNNNGDCRVPLFDWRVRDDVHRKLWRGEHQSDTGKYTGVKLELFRLPLEPFQGTLWFACQGRVWWENFINSKNVSGISMYVMRRILWTSLHSIKHEVQMLGNEKGITYGHGSWHWSTTYVLDILVKRMIDWKLELSFNWNF